MATATTPRVESSAIDRRAAPAPAKARGLLLPVLAVLALIGAGWAFTQWSYNRSHQSTDNAQVDGHLVPVLAKVGGYVRTVRVNDNDHVAAGALLVQIDDAEYRVRAQAADADLAAAQAAAGVGAGSGQAQAAVGTATSQRAALDAQVAAARANEDKANADLRRFQELAAKQIISRQQLDAAAAAAEAARAQRQAAERQAAGAGSAVAGAQAGVRLAQARLGAATAAKENADLQLSYTKVTAPAAGIVSRKQVEVGQLVQPGQPLMTIVADTGVFVTANFKETQLATLKVGQPVDLEVDAYPGCAAKGTVASLSAATGAKFALLPPDNATGNFTKVVQRVPVKVAVTQGCGPDRPLRPGMSVVAHVVTR
ncbi:MAG: HlyD family secretion protein [Gemmatimonadaceae bacterium]